MAKRKLTQEAIDEMAKTHFAAPNAECMALCLDLEFALELLDDPGITDPMRKRLLARLRAIQAQLRAMHCAPCTTIQ